MSKMGVAVEFGGEAEDGSIGMEIVVRGFPEDDPTVAMRVLMLGVNHIATENGIPEREVMAQLSDTFATTRRLFAEGKVSVDPLDMH